MRLTLLLVLLSCGCGKHRGTTGPEGQSSGADGLEVPAMTLWEDYCTDAAAADAKYLDKQLRVTGRVISIEQAPGGHALGLETGPAKADGRVLKAAVVAECGDDAVVEQLRRGDEVVVTCRCEGKIDAPGRVGGIKLTLANTTIVITKSRAR